MTNLYDINQHPNEVMTVDPVFVRCPEKSIRCQLPGNLSGTAVRVTGKSLHEHDDAAAAQFDPEKDDDAAEEAAAVAAFAQNPDDISMEFPGETRSACMCRMRIRHMPQRWATRRISTFSG